MKEISGYEILNEIELDDNASLKLVVSVVRRNSQEWTFWRGDRLIRWLDEFESGFVESTIKAASKKGKSMSKKPLVYLAGPITGLSYGATTSWREIVEKEFGDDIEALSPMRGKTYLLQKTSIADTYEDIVLSSQRAIYCRDMWDCNRCDVLFVNVLGAKTVSIGTVMEVAWAAQHKKPIVLVMEKEGNPHEHAMFREACPFRVESLDSAILLVKTITNVKGVTNALC